MACCWCFKESKELCSVIDTAFLSPCIFAVSPTKEIKIVSAVRRSSMSSCGSSGYFSSSPTLSSSPPVLCNPKSGKHQRQFLMHKRWVQASVWEKGM